MTGAYFTDPPASAYPTAEERFYLGADLTVPPAIRQQIAGLVAERDVLRQIMLDLTAQRTGLVSERDNLVAANAALQLQVAGLVAERDALRAQLAPHSEAA